LETDRNAVLIKRAFLRKVITSNDCAPDETAWWQRTMPLVRTMHEFDTLDLLRTAHQHQCALISHGGLKEESFKDVQTQAKALFQDMMNIVQPWSKKEQDAVLDERQMLIEEFKRRFGDPDDPEVQAKYDKLARDAEEKQKIAQQQAEADAQKVAAISTKSRRTRGKRK
jgi:hypothetical protein